MYNYLEEKENGVMKEKERKQIDTMCEDCAKRGKTCKGSFSGFYTGCIFKVKESRCGGYK